MGVRRGLSGALIAIVLLLSSCASTDEPATSSATAAISNQDAGSPEASEPASANDSTDDASNSQGDEAAAGGESEVGRTDDEPSVNDAYSSPILDALGFDPNDQQQAQIDYVREAEELVRQCMADAGFDYVPNIPSAAPSTTRLWELNASISQDQFVAEYGYGVATLLELDFYEDGILAFVELVLGPAPTDERSEAEQAAYEIALQGETIQGLTAEEAQEESADRLAGFASEGSCRRIGYDTADNSVGDKFDGLFNLLGDEYAELFERVDNDPRIRELNTTWQSCMAGFGYSYESTQDIFVELQDEADALRNGFQSSPEALAIYQAAGDANLAAMDADARYKFLQDQGAFQGFDLVPALQVDLDALITKELTVAGHDAECSDDDTYLAVLAEFEQSFVEQHGEQLELVAAGQTE